MVRLMFKITPFGLQNFISCEVECLWVVRILGSLIDCRVTDDNASGQTSFEMLNECYGYWHIGIRG